MAVSSLKSLPPSPNLGAGAADESPAAVTERRPYLPLVLVGIYAWALTVLPCVQSFGPFSLTGVSGMLAPVLLLVAPWMPQRRYSLYLLLHGFLSLCVVSWWASRELPLQDQGGVFGALGWLAYTFALGSLSKPKAQEEGVHLKSELATRSRPSLGAALLLFLTLLLSLFLLAAAWQVKREHLSVLAHISALAVALILLKTGGRLSAHLQLSNTRLARPLRPRKAVLPLLLLLTVSALGLVYGLLAR